jgi:zinc transporter ZupT
LLVAIFVSNLPEAIGASNDLVAAGRSPRAVRFLWLVVAVVCTLATVVGFAIADTTSGDLRAAINGFAAGALLVMLIDSMIPEGARKAKRPAGLATVLGFRRRGRSLRRLLSPSVRGARTTGRGGGTTGGPRACALGRRPGRGDARRAPARPAEEDR